MTPLRQRFEQDHARQGAPDEESDFLNHLRVMAMSCRIKPRADLFKACALLQLDGSATREAYSEALVRCLDTALGQRTQLFSPGVIERSFDERWLIALARASGREDEPSLSFLLSSRVPAQNRRMIRFLIGRIAGCFELR
ncbi:MAG: hypothetical protein AAGM84_09995 [Pseudomonadota bacterium]